MTLYVILCAIAAFRFVQCELIDLSCDNIREIVDGHNLRRLQLARGDVSEQPPASNMKYMVWDDELAKKAAAWASNDEFQHNPDVTIDSNRFSTGENLYSYSTTAKNYQFEFDKALEAWFKEHDKYRYGPLVEEDFQTSSDDQIGHYTQMAWANTIYVGCGLSNTFANEFNTFMLVCNYGPAGNMIGEPPYETDDGPGEMLCANTDCNELYGDNC